jgi:hypothetical protein
MGSGHSALAFYTKNQHTAFPLANLSKHFRFERAFLDSKKKLYSQIMFFMFYV